MSDVDYSKLTKDQREKLFDARSMLMVAERSLSFATIELREWKEEFKPVIKKIEAARDLLNEAGLDIVEMLAAVNKKASDAV